ncbi:hypothetical protein EMCRGX_G006112 [Ephydatia muelleri]
MHVLRPDFIYECAIERQTQKTEGTFLVTVHGGSHSYRLLPAATPYQATHDATPFVVWLFIFTRPPDFIALAFWNLQFSSLNQVTFYSVLSHLFHALFVEHWLGLSIATLALLFILVRDLLPP